MLNVFRNQNVWAISNLLTENCLKEVQPSLNVQNVPWSRSLDVEHLSEPKRLRSKESTTSDEEVREHRTAAKKQFFENRYNNKFLFQQANEKSSLMSKREIYKFIYSINVRGGCSIKFHS